ncbi:TPA: hypothetical protein HA251_01250 [Candidatus Woesearchaeota archaeon]|nr:hypothetical protein [Candidatus Woesearchaeota archaeon]
MANNKDIIKTTTAQSVPASDLEAVVGGKTAETKTPDAKPAEDEITFSWKRVAKRGLENMKDDVDPIYKGGKMGVYALHGIPTWRREYLDGKLANEGHGWAKISGAFVVGASMVGYATALTAATAVFGPAGYAVLGVPLASQGASYTREAFRRARKTEWSNVVMTRVSKAVTNGTGEQYDLTCDQMVDMVAPAIMQQYGGRYDTGTNAETREKVRAQAKEGLMLVAGKVLDGLFADDEIGAKNYRMSRSLVTGPRAKSEIENGSRRGCYADDDASLLRTTREALSAGLETYVAKQGGTANVELFGKMSAIYDVKSAKVAGYQVDANKLWTK